MRKGLSQARTKARVSKGRQLGGVREALGRFRGEAPSPTVRGPEERCKLSEGVRVHCGASEKSPGSFAHKTLLTRQSLATTGWAQMAAGDTHEQS